MTPTAIGLVQAFFAFVIWGLVPLYWYWLKHVPALEIMVHRVLWSFVILFGIALLRKRLYRVIIGINDKKQLSILLITALLVSSNWTLYIWAVTNGYVIESSLGYYINPLLNMLFGALFLNERLRRFQYMAIIFAFVGVLILTVNYGRLPWIALILGMTFSVYGLLRKLITLDAQTALLIETGLVVIPAFLYLIFGQHSHAIIHDTVPHQLLLIGGGAVTVLPLILMTSSLKVLTLSTVGFMQYIGPTLQFLCGLLVFKEAFNGYQLISFSFIWAGLIIYTTESVINYRHNR